MDNIQQLAASLRDSHVERRRLGDICQIKGRIGFRGYTRADLVEESEGAITLSPSNIHNQVLTFDNCSYISWYKYEESPEIKVSVGDVLFTKTASVGKTALVKYLPKEATINPQLVLLKNIQCDSTYLAYYLQTDEFQRAVKKLTGVGSVPNVPQSVLANLEIPLPPLEAQRGIAAALDRFTELEAELEAELDCRKRQYAFYRERLLDFKQTGGVKLRKLGEICNRDYLRIDVGELTQENYVSVENLVKDRGGRMDCSSLPTKGTFVKYVKNDILIGNIRPYLKKIWLADRDGGTNGDVIIVRIGADYASVLSAKFLYHVLSSDSFFNYDKAHCKEGKMPRGDKKAVFDYTIPVPPLSEQERVAAALDRFERLTTDLAVGLPAEIAARRRQYEYYRDRLLSFPT